MTEQSGGLNNNGRPLFCLLPQGEICYIFNCDESDEKECAMDWNEVTIYTTEEGLDAVSGRLYMLGVTDVSIEQGKASIEAYLESTAKYWDYADTDELVAGDTPAVKAYIPADDENMLNAIRASFEELKAMDVGIELGSLDIAVKRVANEDWENNWKVYFKPLEIGDKLLVCPSWEDPGDTGRAVLMIDPGMAFGTGSHHTTRMCLEFLEERAEGCAELIDLGCGSGILSIAALLMGAKKATGVDIDPVAEKIAGENAALNGISAERFKVMCGDILTDDNLMETLEKKRYDVVCANIAANVLIAFAPLFIRLMAEDGVTIVSGIIDERLDEVKAALEANGLRVSASKHGDEWNALMAVKA